MTSGLRCLTVIRMTTLEEAQNELAVRTAEWLRGRRVWSATYHGLGYSAILFAGLTTVGAALKWQTGLLVALGALTTALTGLTSILRPAYKWRSHRLCHAEAERIRLYLMNGGSPRRAVERIGTLISSHSLAIVGDAGTDITANRNLEEPEPIVGAAPRAPAKSAGRPLTCRFVAV